MIRLVWLPAVAFLLAAAAPPASILETAQARLLRALRDHHVLISGRKLLKVDYVCSLDVGNERLPVIQILEQEAEAMEPRGIDRVVVLNPQLVPVQQVRVFGVTPLFCKGNNLYFSGDVRLSDGSSGNRMTFQLGGTYIRMGEVDPSKLPAPVEK